MNVIQIINSAGASITADSLEITADNTSVTADSITSTIVPLYFLEILPRFYTDTVKLYLVNELTGNEIETTCGATKTGNYLKISFNVNFTESDSFSATVTDLDGKLMWRGKVFATSQQDIQQYKVNVPNNNNVLIV